jgi:hypothetical protein
MNIDDRGLPLHADATAKIRPRIFLEGNFFVDLRQGTPQAPVLEDGDMIKVTQTSTPVQLDEVLTALQDDPREDLKTVLEELAIGFGGRAEGGGQTAAEAINDAYEDIAPAERSTAVVVEALLGTDPERDQQRLLEGLARATEGLGRNEAQLRDLVTNLDRTMGAFAAESEPLRASVRALGPTLRAANQAFDELNAAFPATRAFAREILPGVRETPETIDASFPWIAETRRLLRPEELRGLATDLRPAARDLGGFVDASRRFFPEADRLARCFADVLLPTGDIVVRDEFPTGQPNYRDFAYGLVGLAGEGANHDGNGPMVDFQPGGGETAFRLDDAPSGPYYTNAFPGSASRPRKPQRTPPINTTVPCSRNAIPDLNGPWAARAPFGTVIGQAQDGGETR